jgi:hypothetical protein
MNLRTTTLLALTALCFLALGAGAMADIQINTPAGLQPGDQFRIVFATDAGTAATDPAISTYNTFVNNDATTEAGGGHVTYHGTNLTFSVIGSTATTSAFNNIGGNENIPVYLSSGAEVASSVTTSPGGLWSGQLMVPLDQDLHGSEPTAFSGNVWTGTRSDGTSAAGHELGSPRPVIGNALDVVDWINNSTDDATVDAYQMFGISQILTVPGVTSVPEPSTLGAGAIGTVACLAYGWSRHRREQRRRAAAWPSQPPQGL